MTFLLNEDQTILREAAAGFIAEKSPIAALRRLRDVRGAGFEPSFWQEFAAQGLAGVLVPAAAGGTGLGHVEAGIIAEELGRNLAVTPFLSTALGAVTALDGAKHSGQWLSKIAEGGAIAALALDDGPKHNPKRVTLWAEPDGNGFRLTGFKPKVVFGHSADLLIVAARTAGADDDAEGLTLFALERAGLDLHAEPIRLIDSSLAADLHFDGLKVPGSTVLGPLDQGREILNAVLNSVRFGAAAELLGVGNVAFDMTLRYLSERKQFGVRIGSFQALQHRAAQVYAELNVAAAAVRRAAVALDAGEAEAAALVSVAKAVSGQATALAVQEGVQMHGGIGMTDEHDVGLTIKRARVLNEFFGDRNFHADAFAQASGY